MKEDGEGMVCIIGTVYLIHFERPYWHAQHYLGWTEDLPRRLERHASGDGSPLMRAVQAAGIGWQVAMTWIGDRYLERRLKKTKHVQRVCPICRAR